MDFGDIATSILWGAVYVGSAACLLALGLCILSERFSDKSVMLSAAHSRGMHWRTVVAGLAAIGVLVCMYQGAAALLFWLPDSWGHADEDGDFTPIKVTVAALFAMVAGGFLLEILGTTALNRVQLRSARLQLEGERKIHAATTLAQLDALKSGFEEKLRELRGDLPRDEAKSGGKAFEAEAYRSLLHLIAIRKDAPQPASASLGKSVSESEGASEIAGLLAEVWDEQKRRSAFSRAFEDMVRPIPYGERQVVVTELIEEELRLLGVQEAEDEVEQVEQDLEEAQQGLLEAKEAKDLQEAVQQKLAVDRATTALRIAQDRLEVRNREIEARQAAEDESNQRERDACWLAYVGTSDWDELTVEQQDMIISHFMMPDTIPAGVALDVRDIIMSTDVKKSQAWAIWHILTPLSIMFEKVKLIPSRTTWDEGHKAIVCAFFAGTLFGKRLTQIIRDEDSDDNSSDEPRAAIRGVELDKFADPADFERSCSLKHAELKKYFADRLPAE